MTIMTVTTTTMWKPASLLDSLLPPFQQLLKASNPLLQELLWQTCSIMLVILVMVMVMMLVILLMVNGVF